MVKRKKDPLLEALNEGRSYTWTVPDGGNLASMRKAIKHGQALTMTPITETMEIQVGDFVLVKWHQSDIFHIVGEVQENRFLIVNSLGKENGWVAREAILGKITKIVEPEPRPDVPEIFEQLVAIYQDLIKHQEVASNAARRLLLIVDDLKWYAERIGTDRWDVMPRDNLWSFQQNLWHLTRRAKSALDDKTSNINECIDHGKRCVGMAGEIASIFESYHNNSK